MSWRSGPRTPQPSLDLSYHTPGTKPVDGVPVTATPAGITRSGEVRSWRRKRVSGKLGTALRAWTLPMPAL